MVNMDADAVQAFADDLRAEAAAIAALTAGVSGALGALQGTGWDACCRTASDSVDRALTRMSGRYTAIADSLEQAGKALELTDERFAADLNQIGLRA